jgi:guanylate kinase
LSEGRIIIMTAPSGTGKTTVAKLVFERFENLRFSVSHTTRPGRQGEEHGCSYYFVGDAEFDRMVEENAFAEWAHVHKRRYGTSRAEVQRLLSDGYDILLDVDVQGARSLRKVYPDAISVFLLPPSMVELSRRLTGRGTESDAQLTTRLNTARDEVMDAKDFDFVIVNENIERAALAFGSFLEGRPTPSAKRYDHIENLVKEMLTS